MANISDYNFRGDAQVSAGVDGCERSHASTCEEPFTGTCNVEVVWFSRFGLWPSSKLSWILPLFYLFFLLDGLSFWYFLSSSFSFSSWHGRQWRKECMSESETGFHPINRESAIPRKLRKAVSLCNNEVVLKLICRTRLPKKNIEA